MRVDLLPGVTIRKTSFSEDSRGFSKKIVDEINSKEWTPGETQIFVSKNHVKGSVRGLHYQVSPFAETKLVSCLNGLLHEYLIDMRPESKNYLDWMTIDLIPGSDSILIPPMVAHGYQTGLDDTIVHYVISGNYSKDFSRTINFSDPMIGIELNYRISAQSNSDADAPRLK
jgi:dTDP-4-dehydrorhamnose 3,5-epimerase